MSPQPTGGSRLATLLPERRMRAFVRASGAGGTANDTHRLAGHALVDAQHRMAELVSSERGPRPTGSA